jgi:D-arabinono-1,4-lactone oxidase
VRLAERDGKVVKVIGAAHSPSDIHCTTEWIISLDELNCVLSHDLDTRVITIQAGMRLSKYMEELERRNWRIDNLGSISDQSVAGAICTCTHGSSLVYGTLSNYVLHCNSRLISGGGYYSCTGERDDNYLLT